MTRADARGLERRIWELLPGRADRNRVADAAVLAARLGVPVGEVVAALDRMERSGHAVRDRATGRRSQRWHRGLPYPDAVSAGGGGSQPALW